MLFQTDILTVLLTLVIYQVLANGQCVTKGTTPEIRELVLGRSIDYQTNINPGAFCVNGLSTRRNCTALADLFISAFASQPACNVSYSCYEDFINAANVDVPPGQILLDHWTETGRRLETRDVRTGDDDVTSLYLNSVLRHLTVPLYVGRFQLKSDRNLANFGGSLLSNASSMFWSGVYGVVQMYSNRGQRATVLEDTLIGYMVDRLQFCAQAKPPGITYGEDCPGFEQTDNCSYNAEYSFWAMASKNFASHAKGKVQVMLNASLDQPFRDLSFFGTWEVPNMNASQISNVYILMIHIPGQVIRSTCNSDSISRLKVRLRDKNISSSCEDSPRGPQTMLCVDHPRERECDEEKATSTSSHLA